jgi:RNA polymerase sigma-70 factor (ECF subfamily)
VDETSVHTAQLHAWVERLQGGDRAAADALLRAVCGRLETLAHRMLRADPHVHRWAETGDVLQSALVRLLRSLQSVTPASMRAFYGLAGEQIRRELIDLARRFYGPEGIGARHDSQAGQQSWQTPPYEKSDDSLDPRSLAAWTELHEQAAILPEKEREVFDLLYYHGMKQKEAAATLEVDLSTVQRRWLSALRILRKGLGGAPPGL